ncbi:MAG: SIR2 family protein, partial [Actinomycetota bacterium]|nr:SIR2 family protein [Actinomycetota bacterium]
AAEEQADCDVVLVTHDEGAYSAAQRVRREMLALNPEKGWEELGEKALEAAIRLAREARRSRLVLFLGAGVSAGAGLPGWAVLLQQLAREYGLDEKQIEGLSTFDLRDQAEILAGWAVGRKDDFNGRVAQLLKTGERYSLAHGLLASLSVSESITTNFDELFESACRAWSGGELSVLPYEPAKYGSPWLLKLHGSVHAQESMTLTRTDYRNLAERYGALLGLVQAMLFTRHMLFVGYSLSDDDVHEVVRQVRFARAGGNGKEFGTVVTLFENPLFEKLWPDMSVVSLGTANSKPTPADLGKAARRFEIFLDRLCLEAADLDRHLMDSSYQTMLDDGERKLKDVLRHLQEEIASVPDCAGKEKIETLLSGFGATRDHP